MEIRVPISSGLILKLGAAGDENDYPTSSLQKGILLSLGGQDLAEEGVGFGVPVLKSGLTTIFPGAVELAWLQRGAIHEATARFGMNLTERITSQGSGSVQSQMFYQVKNLMAAVIRRYSPLRGALTGASNVLRRWFGWETTFEDIGLQGNVTVTYTIDPHTGVIHIEVDASDLGVGDITEVVVMNEQGARSFDQYCDSSGVVLHGKEIGCWDVVEAEWASFRSGTHGLAFSLAQVKDTSLFRGRELIGSRLAWAGFGYSFSPAIQRIRFEVRLERFLR
jgi:hypothetical protein